RAVVVEDLRPVFVDAVGGDQHRSALVARADDLEQQVGAVLVDGEVSAFIDDQQVGLQVAAHLALQPAGGLRRGQGVDDVDSRSEEDGVTCDAGGVTEGKGDMRLPEAYGTNEDDVGVIGDEGQTEQVQDLRVIDLFWPTPLEVVHRLEHGEAGFFDAALDGAVLAHGGLALDELSQILKV